MIRIADQQIFGSHTQRIGAVRAQLGRTQEQAASGERVSRPSDDPGAFGHLQRLRNNLAALEDTRNNRVAARTRFQTAEQALGQGSDVVTRLREITMLASNGSLNAENRLSVAQEVEVLRDQMLQVARTRLGDQFVFSGTRTDQMTLDDDGQYQGGSDGALVELGGGQRIDMAIDGEEIFDGGLNVIDTIDELLVNLQNDDPDAVAARLDELDAIEDRFGRARAELGVRLTQVDLTDAIVDELTFQISRESSEVGDADIASVVSRMAEQERALQAAVQVAGRAFEAGLLNIL